LFLTLLVSCLLGLRSLRRKARVSASTQWIIPYTHMFEIGLLAFMISGAFLELAYFDLFYQVVATVGLLGILKPGRAYLPLDPEQPAERRTAELVVA
jgi:hypothetical protein